MAKEITITATLTASEAWQLAQLIKRITFRGVRECACNDDETYTMLNALNRIRSALDDQGYSPR